ncbi:MAG: hypothetical protein JNL39_09570 [Opitutaceae bacterium]|nr:hypothetical protein [Opitutaceae bacterium]
MKRPLPFSSAALLLTLATAPTLFAPHLDSRGVVSYSESEKAQMRNEASAAAARSTYSTSSASYNPWTSRPSGGWIEYKPPVITDSAEQRRAEEARQRAAEQARLAQERAEARARQARAAKHQAEQAAIDKHYAARSAGEESAFVAQALEYLTGRPAIPELGTAMVRINRELASHQTAQITSGPNARWAPVWTAALEVFAGGRPMGGIDRLDRTMLERHPDVAINLALAALLDAKAAPGIHPNDYAKFAPEFRRLAAGVLHTLATPPAAGERARPGLSRAVAALAVHAQRGAPGLPLSPAAAQLVEGTLRAAGATGLDPVWVTFLGNAKAEPVAEPATAAPDFEGVAYVARATTTLIDWLVPVVADLRPGAAAPRPRWLDEPATGGLFRRLVEHGLAGVDAQKPGNSDRRLSLRLALRQLIAPMSAQEDVRYRSWLARVRTYEETPEQHRRDIAPQILLDALEGSPEAQLLLADARKHLDVARVPPPPAWPALDALARNHLPRLESPRLQLTAAHALIQAAGGRELLTTEIRLLHNLIGPRMPGDFTPAERILRMEAMLHVSGEAGVIQAALNTAREKPDDPGAPHVLGFALWLRLQRLQLNAEPTVAEIDEVLALADQLRRVQGNVKDLETSRIDPGMAVAWLLELRRRCGGVGPPGPRAQEISWAINRFQDLRGGPLTAAWDTVYNLVDYIGNEREGSFADRAALDALGRGLMLTKVEREVPGLPTSAWADPWWVQSLALRNKSLAHTRFAVRATAERLASALMSWRFNAEPTKFRERNQAASEVGVILFKRGGAEPLPWHLLGRDLALGGLATRALLLAPTLPDPLKSNDAAIKAWLERVAELPLALPPAAVIDQLAARALDEKFSAADRLNAALGLAAATEPVLRDAADTAGSIAWRKHALTLMAKHADRLPLPSEELKEAGLVFEEVARLAGPRLLRLRVAWELTKIEAPEKSPVERAAAVLKGDPEAAELASYAAFVFATELPPKIVLPEKLERHLMFDPDPSLAPALLRAAPSPTQQEKLISAYLAGQRPKTTEDWFALLDNRAWQ